MHNNSISLNNNKKFTEALNVQDSLIYQFLKLQIIQNQLLKSREA